MFAVDRLGFSTAQYGLLLTTNGIMVVLSQYPVAYGVSKLTKANGLILAVYSMFVAISLSDG